MLNVSYLHVLSRGRMIQSSLIREQETKLYDMGTGNKTVHVMCALKEHPTCVCVCVCGTTQNRVALPWPLAALYSMLHAHVDATLSVRRTLSLPVPQGQN